MRHARGVKCVLIVSVAVADVEVDMVARVERFVPRDGAQVAACVRRVLVLFVGVAVADVEVAWLRG